VPKLVDYGTLVMTNFRRGDKEPKCFSYYIMPKYEVTLEDYLKGLKGVKKAIYVLEVAIQLVSIMELVHKSNRTFNDLKPENVMINTKYASRQISVFLIDFGFAGKFIDENGKHISENETLDMFLGNLLFASPDQMNFYKTSRKDDIQSLFYMVIYLLNNQAFVCRKDKRYLL